MQQLMQHQLMLQQQPLASSAAAPAWYSSGHSAARLSRPTALQPAAQLDFMQQSLQDAAALAAMGPGAAGGSAPPLLGTAGSSGSSGFTGSGLLFDSSASWQYQSMQHQLMLQQQLNQQQQEQGLPSAPSVIPAADPSVDLEAAIDAALTEERLQAVLDGIAELDAFKQEKLAAGGRLTARGLIGCSLLPEPGDPLPKKPLLPTAAAIWSAANTHPGAAAGGGSRRWQHWCSWYQPGWRVLAAAGTRPGGVCWGLLAGRQGSGGQGLR
jgi:hypothetical protein